MNNKKLFYSKRRLKKMGIYLEETQDKIYLSYNNFGGNIRQAYNIGRMLKNINKQIEVRLTLLGSCGVWSK